MSGAPQSSNDSFRVAIEQGDVRSVQSALHADRVLANRTIHWYLNQPNESDPLHHVSDCVGNGWLINGSEGELAKLLVRHGARLNGNSGREAPLIAAASLGAARVARVLVDAGADLEVTGHDKAGESAIEMSKRCARQDMYDLLEQLRQA